MTERNFTGYLVLNWRNGDIRVVKRKPRYVHPSEILIKLDIKVIIPPKELLIAKGEVILPKTKVKELAIDYIEGTKSN